jgi:hypothetical protein
LESEIELPDAASDAGASIDGTAPGHADCVVEHRRGPAPEVPQRLLGEEPVHSELMVRCFETRDGLRLVYDDTGTFDISASGDRVTWWQGADPPMDAVQTDLLGRVMALVLHCRGILTLHASAVRIGGQGVVLLAPKGFGKSSLAIALVRAGARLISDDTVAVESTAPPVIRPGVQMLRLRPDSASRHQISSDGAAADKVRFRPDEEHAVGGEKTALSALYLLRPTSPSPDLPAVTREPCAPVAAALALTAFRKLGALLDGRTGAASLRAAADLVGLVPVYTLHVQRTLDRLEEVVAEMARWHSADPALVA